MEVRMEYQRLALSEEQCEALLPGNVYRMYLDGKIGLYGGLDEDLLVCYAAFSPSVDREMVILEYIYVDEAYRSRWLSKELFDYCCNLFYENGFRSVYVRLTGHFEDLLGPTLFMKKFGFLMTTYKDRFLEYYVTDLIETDQMVTIAKSRDKLPETETFSSISDRRLKRLAADENLGWQIDPGCFDSKLSYFYMKDGEISAALICNKPERNRMLVSSFTFTKNGVNPFMFSVMLYDAIESAWDGVTQSTKISIYVTDPKILKLLQSYGANKTDDFHVHEFLYIIPDRRKEVNANE